MCPRLLCMPGNGSHAGLELDHTEGTKCHPREPSVQATVREHAQTLHASISDQGPWQAVH
eukprot:4867697-Karenia_brevis.AAC.1